MSIVLRASSSRWSAAELEKRLPRLRVEQRWQKGEREGKRVLEASGVSACLSESDDPTQGVRDAQRTLEMVGDELSMLAAEGTRLVLDLALFVPAVRPAGVILSAEFLNLCVRCGLELVVSAFPIAEE